jgi:hypothetical protein
MPIKQRPHPNRMAGAKRLRAAEPERSLATEATRSKHARLRPATPAGPAAAT